MLWATIRSASFSVQSNKHSRHVYSICLHTVVLSGRSLRDEYCMWNCVKLVKMKKKITCYRLRKFIFPEYCFGSPQEKEVCVRASVRVHLHVLWLERDGKPRYYFPFLEILSPWPALACRMILIYLKYTGQQPMNTKL